MLGQDTRDREIGTWAEGVATHYERKRRAEILESARKLILMEGDERWVRVDLHVPAEVHDVPKQDKTPAPFSEQPSDEEDAWGLWDEGKPEMAAEEEQVDGWGFEDEEPGREVESQPEADPTPLQPPPDLELHANVDDEDPANAWGWNDDEDQLVNHLLQPLSGLSAGTPFIFSRGNHETRGKFARRLPDYFNSSEQGFYFSCIGMQ